MTEHSFAQTLQPTERTICLAVQDRQSDRTEGVCDESVLWATALAVMFVGAIAAAGEKPNDPIDAVTAYVEAMYALDAERLRETYAVPNEYQHLFESIIESEVEWMRFHIAVTVRFGDGELANERNRSIAEIQHQEMKLAPDGLTAEMLKPWTPLRKINGRWKLDAEQKFRLPPGVALEEEDYLAQVRASREAHEQVENGKFDSARDAWEWMLTRTAELRGGSDKGDNSNELHEGN